MVLPVGLALGCALLGATPIGTSLQYIRYDSSDLKLHLRHFTDPGTTKAVLYGTFAVLLASEIAIVVDRAQGHSVPTISKILQDWGRNYSLLPYTLGVLCGHWWWNSTSWPSRNAMQLNAVILIMTALVVFMWDLNVRQFGEKEGLEKAIRRQPIVPFMVGIVAGHVFWPQKELR